MKINYVILLSLSVVVGHAQAKTLADAVKECGQVQNSLKRLVCYDKVVNDMKQFDGLDALMSVPAPLPPSAVTPRQQSNDNTKQQGRSAEQFGLPQQSQSEIVGDKMYATLTRIEYDPYKKAIFTLDSNQVWKQADGKSVSLDVNDKVYIEEGMLGAYYLSTDRLKKRIKVKRVK